MQNTADFVVYFFKLAYLGILNKILMRNKHKNEQNIKIIIQIVSIEGFI